MIRNKCTVCKKIWYCKADDRCEKEWERREKPLGACMCPRCSRNLVITLDPQCEAVKYEYDWRIA